MESVSTLHSQSDERTFLSGEHIAYIKSRMNKQCTDGMKLAGPKVTFKFLLELQLERKNNSKRPHVNKKAKEFSSLCHCYHRVYNGKKCPLRITLLDRFA